MAMQFEGHGIIRSQSSTQKVMHYHLNIELILPGSIISLQNHFAMPCNLVKQNYIEFGWIAYYLEKIIRVHHKHIFQPNFYLFNNHFISLISHQKCLMEYLISHPSIPIIFFSERPKKKKKKKTINELYLQRKSFCLYGIANEYITFIFLTLSLNWKLFK